MQKLMLMQKRKNWSEKCKFCFMQTNVKCQHVQSAKNCRTSVCLNIKALLSEYNLHLSFTWILKTGLLYFVFVKTVKTGENFCLLTSGVPLFLEIEVQVLINSYGVLHGSSSHFWSWTKSVCKFAWMLPKPIPCPEIKLVSKGKCWAIYDF